MNPAAPPAPQVIILAAGFSSRLGRPKALTRIRSVSLLRRTLAVVAPLAAAKIILVLPRNAARYRTEALGFDVIFEINPHRHEGLSSSVRRGLTRARYSPAALLLPVDLAGLRRREVARLISRWRATRRRVVARRTRPPDGAPHNGALPAGSLYGGVPVILPHWLFANARKVAGDIGLRELIRGLAPHQQVLLNLPSGELDVDTPQDLRAARRYSRAFCTSR